jgi:ABC-type spermidine/putrescine transport system permease subunit II
VLGTFLAIGLRDLNRWVQIGLLSLMFMTIVTPEVITGLATLIYFRKTLDVQLGMWTIVATHVVFNAAIVGFIVRTRLAGMERTLEEASADLGAPPWKTFLTITIPLLTPAIFAGAILAFTFSFDDYVLSFFTHGTVQTLPLRIWGQLRFKVSPEANAVASIMIAFSLMMVVLATLLYQLRAWQVGFGGRELFTGEE